MASCGCGGSSNSAGAASGPLLSGSLDGGAYAGDAAPDTGIAAADVAGPNIEKQFRVGGFWFLVVVLVVGTAWYLDSKKSGDA